MNVSQALKQKNKLAIELKKQYNIAQRYNQIEEGNIRRYSAQEALDKASTLAIELTELKTKIHLANAPVYSKIFQMAELKGRIKELKQIPIQEGKQAGSYGSSETVKEVEINVAEIDKMVEQLELQIESIQSELDIHNSTTQI
jgi:hypothetical protein